MAIQFKILKGSFAAVGKKCNKLSGFIAVEPISGCKDLWRIIYKQGVENPHE